MRTQTTRTMAGRVAGAAGTRTSGVGTWAVRKAATGAWYLTFPPDFRLMTLNATAEPGGAAYFASVDAPAGNEVVVRVWSPAGAAADQNWTFTATGASA